MLCLSVCLIPFLVGCESSSPEESSGASQVNRKHGGSSYEIVGKLNFVDLEGKALKPEKFLGEPLVLNLWATWCLPCRDEMPALNELAKRLRSKNINVVAASVDEDTNLVKEFILKYGIDMDIILTNRNAVEQSSWLTGYPTTVLFNEQGAKIKVLQGAQDWLALDIERYFSMSKNGEYVE